jgi:hypothetical protein
LKARSAYHRLPGSLFCIEQHSEPLARLLGSREGRPMAESGKNCVLCGAPLKIFSGLTLNGDSYHDFCWERRDRAAPKVRPSTAPDRDSNAPIVISR